MMKARIIPIAFFTIVLSVYTTYYHSADVIMILPIFAFTVCFILKAVYKKKISFILFFLIWALFFAGYTIYKTDYMKSPLGKYMDKECVVYGKITDVEKESSFYKTYIIEIDKVRDVKTGMPVKVNKEKANFYIRKDKNLLSFKYGDYVCAKAVAESIEGAKNAFDKDYGLINYSDGLFYTLTCDEGDVSFSENPDKKFVLDDFIYKVREYVYKVSEKMLSRDAEAFTVSILISEKRYLSNETYKSLQDAGLMHLSAASGLHVNCILSMFIFLFGIGGISKRLARVLSVPAILMFVFISGAGESVIRAAIMIFMAILSKFVRRQYDLFISLCFAGIVILFINPLAIFSAGFVLSFAAVFAISIFTQDMMNGFDELFPKKAARRRGSEFLRLIKLKLRKYFKATLSVSVAVLVFIMPLCAYYFDYITPYSVLTNLIVSWLLPAFMLSAFMMIAFGWLLPVSEIFAFFTECIANVILFVAKCVSKLPLSRIELFVPLWGIFAIMCAALAVHYLIRKRKALLIIYSSLCLLTVSVNICVSLLKSDAVRVSFVNAGQGDGCVIKDGSDGIIIDAGEPGKSAVFLNYIKWCGIKKVSYVFVSHYDSDHAANVLDIIERFDVENVVLPIRKGKTPAYKKLIEDKAIINGCNIIHVKENDRIYISENIKAYVYSPDDYYTVSGDENEAGAAIKLNVKGKDILFLADLTKEVQDKISGKYREDLNCDILKVAHHGSNDAYSQKLMDIACPEFAVISCGEKNIYRHPHEEVRYDLMKRNIKTFITAQRGDVTFYIRENKMTEIRCFK